jgi:prepilin-type N-terminal cleavage/methylation domain-containing protein
MKTRENRRQELGDRSQKHVHSLESTVQGQHGARNTSETLSRARAFTLIELLVVIAVISLLAAMIFPITGAVNRNKIRTRARGELTIFETAIEAYKAKLGYYPPDNPGIPATNQLYYELLGTTNSNNGTIYTTLDGGSQINTNAFPRGIGGFVNANRVTAADETKRATKFLLNLKPGQIGDLGNGFKILTSSVPWPQDPSGLNPVRYNSSNPTNNPNSFDLWIDVVISGKTNRISNWSKDPIVVSKP